ncbi:MAG TPA: DNA polymerase III subunit gamma/tau, partial [Polyangia bacterium]|nr:DNA polymerase III subunit gamma/tau [Polyangia bacterium]
MSQFAPLSRRPPGPKAAPVKTEPPRPTPAAPERRAAAGARSPAAQELRELQRARLDAMAERVVALASGLATLQRQPAIGDVHAPAETEAQRAAEGAGAAPVAKPTAPAANAPALL